MKEWCADATKQLLTVFRSVPTLSAAPHVGPSEAVIGLIVLSAPVFVLQWHVRWKKKKDNIHHFAKGFTHT